MKEKVIVTWYQAIAWDVAEGDYVSLGWGKSKRDTLNKGRKYLAGWCANIKNNQRALRLLGSLQVIEYDMVTEKVVE